LCERLQCRIGQSGIERFLCRLQGLRQSGVTFLDLCATPFPSQKAGCAFQQGALGSLPWLGGLYLYQSLVCERVTPAFEVACNHCQHLVERLLLCRSRIHLAHLVISPADGRFLGRDAIVLLIDITAHCERVPLKTVGVGCQAL